MGGRDPSIRQRVEMVITTKDDLFNVRSRRYAEAPLECWVSSVRAVDRVYLEHVHVHVCCTITKPDAARDHFPHSAPADGFPTLQGRLTRRARAKKQQDEKSAAAHAVHRTKATNAERGVRP